MDQLTPSRPTHSKLKFATSLLDVPLVHRTQTLAAKRRNTEPHAIGLTLPFGLRSAKIRAPKLPSRNLREHSPRANMTPTCRAVHELPPSCVTAPQCSHWYPFAPATARDGQRAHRSPPPATNGGRSIIPVDVLPPADEAVGGALRRSSQREAKPKRPRRCTCSFSPRGTGRVCLSARV